VNAIRADGKPVELTDAAPAFADTPLKTVILHDAAKRALGAFLPAQNQPRGTCTSRGLKRHLDLQQCSRIAGGEPLAFHEVNHAIIYGLGREIAGMLGGNPNDQNDDGCTGAAVARGAVKGGGGGTNDSVGGYDASGGAGGGGGLIVLVCNDLSGTGQIRARGGAGALSGSLQGNNGGGGGGGVLWVGARKYSGTLTGDVVAGTGSVSGSAGLSQIFEIKRDGTYVLRTFADVWDNLT
jgi:hypothetical protein